MKTNKEYPATHSMMTSWFAIDEDGNVAIMNYEDNGPVPTGTPENNPEDLIMDDIPHAVDGMPYKLMNLTKEQVSILLENSAPCEEISEYGYCNLIVKIAEDKMDTFLNSARDFMKDGHGVTVCLDEDERLFYLDWFAYDHIDKAIINNLHRLRVVKPIRQVLWQNEDGDDTLHMFPFYVYTQSYSCGQPMERTHVPQLTFKEDRLSEEMRKKAHRLPLRFAECNKIQIAEHLPSHSYGCDARLINNRPYSIVTDADNKDYYMAEESIYYAGCGKSCRTCYSSEERHVCNFAFQKTKHPTVLVITDISDWDYDILVSFDLPYNKSVFLPIVEGLPTTQYYLNSDERRLERFPIKEMFAKCRKNLEKNIEFFKPRVILLFEDILQHITNHYKIENGIIHIAGDDYPVYIWEQREQHMEELIQLASMDYRGGEIEWKIPVEVKP